MRRGSKARHRWCRAAGLPVWLAVAAAAIAAEVPVAGEGEPAAPATLAERIDELLLGSEQRTAAREAILAAGDEAIPLLTARLDDPEFTIRWEMMNILGAIGDPAAAAAVARQATRDSNRHVRWRGYWALTSMSGDGPRKELRRLLADEDEWVAWNAAVALTLFDDRSVASRLVQGLSSPDMWTRWEAANGLRKVGDESAVPALAKLLQATEVQLRQEAVLTLAAIDGGQVTTLLLSALEDPSPQVRWRAVAGLSRRGITPEVRSRLEELRAVEKDPLVLEQLADIPPPRTRR
jgi:HEAT repeat protein